MLNAHVYGSALHACVKGGQRKRALALLDEMLGNGVVPDAVVFTAAIGAVDGWAAALRLLTLMKNEVRLGAASGAFSLHDGVRGYIHVVQRLFI